MNRESEDTAMMLNTASKKVSRLIEKMSANCGWITIGILFLVLVLVSVLALAL